MPSVTAYIALGSNLGDRAANLRAALERLAACDDTKVVQSSTPFENPAVGGPEDSPPFLNAAAELRTVLTPRVLLTRLLDVERELGRVRREKWGPRVIDLDVLLYDGQVIHEEGLVIPHPLLHTRRFALHPLAEIAPNVVHPTLHETVARLLEALPSSA